jgi:hypothetical protein
MTATPQELIETVREYVKKSPTIYEGGAKGFMCQAEKDNILIILSKLESAILRDEEDETSNELRNARTIGYKDESGWHFITSRVVSFLNRKAREWTERYNLGEFSGLDLGAMPGSDPYCAVG